MCIANLLNQKCIQKFQNITENYFNSFNTVGSCDYMNPCSKECIGKPSLYEANVTRFYLYYNICPHRKKFRVEIALLSFNGLPILIYYAKNFILSPLWEGEIQRDFVQDVIVVSKILGAEEDYGKNLTTFEIDTKIDIENCPMVKILLCEVIAVLTSILSTCM